jgi:hypothetical protein
MFDSTSTAACGTSEASSAPRSVNDERHVGLADERELLVALGARRGLGRHAAFQLREPLRHAEMQVDRIEGDQRVRRERAHRVDVLGGDVMPGQHDEVELAPASRQAGPRSSERRAELHLDAAAREVVDVGLPVFEVVGDERDLALQRGEDLEPGLHAHRARVLVGRQHAGVDDQHAQLRPAVALHLGTHAVLRMAASSADHFAAKLSWLSTWWRLTPWWIGAGRLAFEMDDRAARLVEDLAARRAHREREVGVLVVRGRVSGGRIRRGVEQLAPDGEARAGAVVRLAQVVVLGRFGIVVAPVVPRGAVAPHDAARFLQAAVRVHELRAHEARIGHASRTCEQRVEPARA